MLVGIFLSFVILIVTLWVALTSLEQRKKHIKTINNIILNLYYHVLCFFNVKSVYYLFLKLENGKTKIKDNNGHYISPFEIKKSLPVYSLRKEQNSGSFKEWRWYDDSRGALSGDYNRSFFVEIRPIDKNHGLVYDIVFSSLQDAQYTSLKLKNYNEYEPDSILRILHYLLTYYYRIKNKNLEEKVEIYNKVKNFRSNLFTKLKKFFKYSLYIIIILFVMIL